MRGEWSGCGADVGANDKGERAKKEMRSRFGIFAAAVLGGAIFLASCLGAFIGLAQMSINDACTATILVASVLLIVDLLFAFSGREERARKKEKNKVLDKEE